MRKSVDVGQMPRPSFALARFLLIWGGRAAVDSGTFGWYELRFESGRNALKLLRVYFAGASPPLGTTQYSSANPEWSHSGLCLSQI